MVLRICVPAIHSPFARNWNCASDRWSATAAMVAKSLGVSTPFIGTRGRFVGAGISMVVALMVGLLSAAAGLAASCVQGAAVLPAALGMAPWGRRGHEQDARRRVAGPLGDGLEKFLRSAGFFARRMATSAR